MALSGSSTINGVKITLSMSPTYDYVPLTPTGIEFTIKVENTLGSGVVISNPTIVMDAGSSPYNKTWPPHAPFGGDTGGWDGSAAPINPGETRNGTYSTSLSAAYYKDIKEVTIYVRALMKESEWTTEYFYIAPFIGASLDSEAAHTPTITELTARRCDADGNLSDEGQYVRNLIKGAIAPRAGLTSAQHTLRVGYRLQGSTGAFTWINKTGFSASININERLNTGAVFAPGSIYEIRCELINNQRSITAHATSVLPKAFANLHLSGSGYGVGVGQYSTATEEEPKFECAYPAHFYGGIRQLDYSTERMDTGAKWIDGKTIYRKVIPLASMAAGAIQEVSVGESIIDKVVAISGGSYLDSNWRPIPYVNHSVTVNQILIAINSLSSNPVVRIRTGTGVQMDSGFVVIEYTLP